jgi:O-antigen/teichoic acid export membrane protein
MGTAVTQAVARGYEGSLIPALKTKIRWGILGGLASLILAGYHFYQGNTTLTISFLISAVFLPFMDSFGIYDSLLQGRKLFDVSTKYFIISQIIAIASLIAVLFFTKNLFFILFTYFASWAMLRFIFLKITLKKFPLNQNQDPKTISYGKHLSLIKGINIATSSVGNIALFHFVSSQALAVYSFGVAPIEQLRSFVNITENLLLPKISTQIPTNFKLKNIIRKTAPFLAILLLIIIIYIIIAPTLYTIFFPRYLESIIFSRIYSISLFFTTINIIQMSILKAIRAVNVLHTINTINTFLNLGLIIPMVNYFQIYGLIYAIILIKIILMLIIGYFIFMKRPFNLNNNLSINDESGNLTNQ